LTRLILIRHAEAEGNLYRRAHGHYNSLLTKNGLEQAERLGDWFSRRPVDAVYASDLYRTVRTAEAVASVCQKKVTAVPELRELSLGEWEDIPWGKISRNWKANLWFEKKADWSPKGAESVEGGGRRVHAALSRLAAAHEGETVAVVSHGCVLREFLEIVTGERLPQPLDNASISLVEWEGGTFKAGFIGDNRHLGELSTLAKQSWWRDDPAHPDPELWFSAAALPSDLADCMGYSRGAWHTIYGTLEGFDDRTTEKTLYESAETDPRYLQFAMEGGERAGLLHMRDAGRLSVTDGHISLLYLEPGRRGRGLGAQLLGEAVSVARSHGKRGLSLRVYRQNTPAASFYSKMGFAVCGSEKGLFGTLIQMRLNIEVPKK
jgi:probable phosphoglycerate mutase